ncbi:MAG: GntR family transcriptional regulator [Brevundimonas sp.]|uniref:GntR family transcriptional regulator n=1 Tax=Brevundimonas sp. TaxID=1871086 RepID=UPI0025B8919D|nr:GntR family transcriptional regulator [Brevundimonas sp.]MBX3478453.1 GntR family transcriptional regulator [Brevundimonas sp.]
MTKDVEAWPLPEASHLDESLPTPLYHQIYLVLREQIRSGTIPPNALLPGEQQLAKMFNVSRITVKRALNELAADGLLNRHRGRGTIVTDAAAVPVVKGSFDNLLESLRIMGLETEIEVLDVANLAAGAAIAKLLEIEPGAQVQRAVRRRKLQGEPFSYLVTHVPGDIADRYSVKDLATTSMLTLLERSGAAVFDAEQWITAVAAEPLVASALGVSVGGPLLKVERVMRDVEGRPVQLIHSHYRSDRFQYHIKTHRRKPPGGGKAES